MSKAIVWVDNLKAVCIFLVVYGHFAGLLPEFKSLIYSMHLPAFLIVTGYLSAKVLRQPSPGALITNQIFYYLLLYGLFSLAASVVWYLFEARGQSITLLSEPLMGSLLGLHGPALKLIHNDDPLWYFPFLITSLLTAFVFLRSPIPIKMLLIVMTVIAYQFHLLAPFAWSLDLAPIGAFFILLGVCLAQMENNPRFFLFSLNHALSLIGIGIIWLALVWLNGRVNLNSREFGNSWVLFLLAAICGSVFFIGLCKKIPESNLARQLSRHTLIIFCTHIYFVKALNGYLSSLSEPAQQIAILVSALVVTFICWILSVFTQPLITQWLKPKPSISLAMQKRS